MNVAIRRIFDEISRNGMSAQHQRLAPSSDEKLEHLSADKHTIRCCETLDGRAIRCRVLFPGSTAGLCSINKSIFSPIQGYLVSNRFTILRSPPARPIFDSDIMSRLREINDLNFPLIETPWKAIHATFAGGVRAIFGNEDRFCVYKRERIYLAAVEVSVRVYLPFYGD